MVDKGFKDEGPFGIFKHFKIGGEQVFFPKYAFSISVMAILLIFSGITIGATLERFMPKFDATKTKPEMIVEISLQIALVATFTYLFREIFSKIIKRYFGKYIYGSPDKFAVLVVAPTMFSQQDSLFEKIDHVWKNIREVKHSLF
tara:strand:+ start:726 stop:1160 length:435 start_codon:yes stop_codon:yes gene_type:complete